MVLARGALYAVDESHLPITGDNQPDGKRIVAKIRTLLDSGLEEPPNS